MALKRNYVYMICLLLGAVMAVSSLVKEFYNTLPDGQWACMNEEVNFTCKALTQGTQWFLSNDYIGDGRRSLEFASIDSIGDQRTSSIDSRVYALLMNNTLIDGVPFLTSLLHIIVMRGEQLSQSIICQTSDDSKEESIIRIHGSPGEPQNCSAVNKTSEGRCFIHINWIDPPSDVLGPVDHYIIEINGTNNSYYNDTAYSAPKNSTVECGSVYNIYMTAINRCDLKGSRVPVGTVNATLTSDPNKAMAMLTGKQYGFSVILAIWIAVYQ